MKFALPKGRMYEGVISLLSDAGVKIRLGGREYRPTISLPEYTVKILKPQNIIEMLAIGSRDLGFAGADWVHELGVSLVELLDTELDPVRIVAAAPADSLKNGALPEKPLIVASEYEVLAKKWIDDQKLDAKVLRSYGATEVFPPEDADCIIDNTATGETLRANGLEIIDTLLTSSTRLYANPRALEDRSKRERIENLVIITKSVLEARKRVMVEVNISGEQLDALIRVLPSMRKPTVSPLHNSDGFAVRAAVLRSNLAHVIPELKACGGTDIVVSRLLQITA